MRRSVRRGALTVGLLAACATGLVAQDGASGGDAPVWLAVANESSDLLSIVRFDGTSLALEREIPVGIMPADLDGAHGVAATPDGSILVSLAHGTPFGKLWRIDRRGALLDSATVGRFPASIAVSEDGVFAFVSNFNLHGDPVPSSVSVLFVPDMTEVARVETCVRPHGGRLSPGGETHYSVCAGDQQLVEISVDRMAVARRLALPDCGPTWVVPGAEGRWLYVACNAADHVAVVSTAAWRVERRLSTGRGPYNLVLTPDGERLLATNKAGRSLSIVELATGAETRVETSEALPHGVVVSRDGRFAFVTNEAVGARPGTLDAIGLDRLALIGSLELRLQPGGIAILPDEEP